jgi:hypothetical protein
MKALLMHPDRDFDLQQPLPWNEAALRQDLELDTVLHAMAASDEFLLEVTRKALLTAMANGRETILYRQEILKDCLRNPETVRELYQLIVSSLEAAGRQWWGLTSRYPASVLYSSTELLEGCVGVFRKLRQIAEQHATQFTSTGLTALFAMFSRELAEDYLADLRHHLATLQFRKGVLFSAGLGDSNESNGYVLLKPHGKDPNWFERLIGKRPPGYTYHLDPHDEAGGRIMSEMRSRAIARVARALAQSADHVVNFFKMLRTELAFYIGGLNLHDLLIASGLPIVFPQPTQQAEHRSSFTGLYDVSLALRMQGPVVGNSIRADGRNLVIITGANQGGKSTFLRSIGVAQLMMQCGLFVGAESFTAEISPSLLTHYKREEDATMNSGKLDEELARMSEIVNHIEPHSLLLFNESFAATNEREGSEIARQIVCALREKRVRVFYVTHLHELARLLYESKREDAVFLRSERLQDGTRTFKLVEAPPLETSYGEDLYREVFGVGAAEHSRT